MGKAIVCLKDSGSELTIGKVTFKGSKQYTVEYDSKVKEYCQKGVLKFLKFAKEKPIEKKALENVQKTTTKGKRTTK